MAKCSVCRGDLVCRSCASSPLALAREEGDGAVLPCAQDKCAATIYVRNAATQAGIGNAKVSLTGAGAPPQTDGNGFAIYKDLDPGEHVAKLSLAGLDKKFQLPKGKPDSITRTIPAGSESFYVFDLDPIGPLTVVVKRKDKPSVLVPGARVSIAAKGAGNTPAVDKGTTGDDGKVVFENLRKDSYDLTIALDGEVATTHAIVDAATQSHPFDPAADRNEVEFLVARMIYLRLRYKDPEDQLHDFPKDFEATVRFNDDSTQVVKVLDDAGQVEFAVPAGKSDFTLSFDSAKRRFLVHGQASTGAPWKLEAPLLEDPDDAALQRLTLDDKRFFALPKKWSLVNAPWEPTGVTLPDNGRIAIPDGGGIGSKTAPGVLVLAPVCQYARFEFHDRKYGHADHADKRVPLPAVTVKAARKATAAGDPEGGEFGATSNWMVDATDAAKAAQALPWIVTKTDAGAALPKLDKTMLIQFGWTDAFVHSTSATVRKIVEIPASDARRKPTKDRHLYYDLPATWKSINYFTRFADPAKSRFFDELSETEVGASLVKTTPFVFSLDDIVLETVAGSQRVTDKKRDGTAIAIDKHSRIAILHCDEADKLKPKVFDPRPLAPFHSKTEFRKVAASDARRNYLSDYPSNARAIVFCSGFHDVHDKRATTADFARKDVVGARVARLNDADISGGAAIDGFASGSYAAAYTCKDSGNFDLRYLHCAATDGTTVFGIYVTFWSSRFFFQDSNSAIPTGSGYDRDELFKVDKTKRGNGTLADKLNYVTEGMANAMTRWNEKNYQIEERDDKKDVAIKAFCLFEAKEFEEPAGSGTFVDRGGLAHCDSALATDDLGSWMAKKISRLRRSGYRGEGEERGSAATTETRLQEFDGKTSPPRLTVAHEIGHASGLDDDYVYSVEGYRGLVRYKQYFPGMPYNADPSSLMKSNQAVRLRHFWGRVNWLNDASGSSLNGLLAGRQFKICYEPPGKPKLTFELTGARYKQIYLPAYEAGTHALEQQGRCGFFLYKLGDDEFNRWLKGGSYAGMLVVVLKLSAKFENALVPAPPAWVDGRNYAEKACVQRAGESWVCTSAHRSSPSFATDQPHWRKISASGARYPWHVGTEFEPGEWTSDGTHAYQCQDIHVAGSFAADLAAGKWIKIRSTRGPWTVETDYDQGDQLMAGSTLCICAADHNSRGFNADIGNFEQLDHRTWIAGAGFGANFMVTVGGIAYRAAGVHTSSDDFAKDLSAGHWTALAYAGPWTFSNYQAGDLVDHNGNYYQCAATHRSSGFRQDVAAGNWIGVTARKGAYLAATAYAKGECVTYDDKNYICAVAHTSGSLADDIAAGHWIRPDSQQQSWNSSLKRDWASGLTKSLNKMLEDANGKYMFSCGSGDFRKVYLRLFVQWEFPKPTAAATAGTHFEFNVVRDGKSWLTTNGNAIEAGNECSRKTIIRYLFGKASENADTRASDTDITKPLAKADLSRLAAWIKSQAGGDYVVEDIP